MSHTIADFTLPAKRGVKLLTDRLVALESGTRAEAKFSTPRYGVFFIDGSVQFSPAVNMLTLGGRFIEQSMKPDKSLQVLEVEELPEVRQADDTDALTAAVASLTHGDLVEAQFHHRAYGDFTVSGVAVWSVPSAAFLVGGWLVGGPGNGSATPAPRLISFTTIAAAGSHAVTVPASITRIGDDADMAELG